MALCCGRDGYCDAVAFATRCGLYTERCSDRGTERTRSNTRSFRLSNQLRLRRILQETPCLTLSPQHHPAANWDVHCLGQRPYRGLERPWSGWYLARPDRARRLENRRLL